MPYNTGGIITATDIDAQVAKINTIFGTGTGDRGYGGNSINTGVASDLVTVSQGDLIRSATGTPDPIEEWANIRNALIDCATHQGTILPNTPPATSDLEDGDIITAGSGLFPNLDVANTDDNVALLDTNRANTSGAGLAVLTLGTDVRNDSWTMMLRHEFTVTFTDEDAARHFFNTGGEIRISADRIGGAASSQNADWTTLLAANPPYLFNGTDYFDLTTDFVPKRSVPGAGLYSSNMWDIRAKADSIPAVNGGKGSVLRFQSDFLDVHTNVFFDVVDGTLTSTIEQRKSVTIFPQATPVFATTVPLSAGT